MRAFSRVLTAVVLLVCVKVAESSVGDRSPFYQKCVNKCSTLNCTDDGLYFLKAGVQPLHLTALYWTCDDECRYDCMWTTVHSFKLRSWDVPQFYGKWPFIRLLGLQEPASVLFSVLNAAAHYRMLRQFRKEVRPQAPYYWMWQCFAVMNLNAWLWSVVFHARDIALTELLDYASAYAVVLFSLYTFGARLLYGRPALTQLALAIVSAGLFAQHVTYLALARLDYAYNMRANIVIGLTTAFGWLGWCAWHRVKQPYVWRCAVFVLLAGLCMLFEVADFPPILWLVDAHSLWHLGTAFLPFFFYRFLIDDCKYLKKQADLEAADRKNKFY